MYRRRPEDAENILLQVRFDCFIVLRFQHTRVNSIASTLEAIELTRFSLTDLLGTLAGEASVASHQAEHLALPLGTVRCLASNRVRAVC